MTSSKLQILARQLGNGIPPDAPESASSATNKMLMSYKTDCDRESAALVKAAEVKQHRAEADNAALIVQLSDLNKELSQVRNNMMHKMDDLKDVAKQEIKDLSSKHNGEAAALASQINALRGQVATERQERIRAETEKEASEKMVARLEQTLTKLQSTKPAALAAPQKPVSFTSKVTQRDENGRIVAMVTTPQL